MSCAPSAFKKGKRYIISLVHTCIEVKAVCSSVKDRIRQRLNVTLQLNIQEIIFRFDPDRYDCSSQIAEAIQRLVLMDKSHVVGFLAEN